LFIAASNRASQSFVNTTIDDKEFHSATTTTTTTTTPRNAANDLPPKATTTINNNTHESVRATTSSSSTSTVIGDFETEMVFITDVLEPVFDTFRAIASEQGIAFEVLVENADDLPGVFVAPKSFREATSNVLDNALKYVLLPKPGSGLKTNPAPRVRVRIFPNDGDAAAADVAAAATTPGVIVLVEDNGPGVAVDDRHKIFERGFRSETTASEVRGRGIGLDISRALMARMGGSLGLATEEDCCCCESEGPPDRLDGAALKLEVTRKPHKRID
jgi:light-regulated signal transduction histidine kinase (bacteriophytochrome)